MQTFFGDVQLCVGREQIVFRNIAVGQKAESRRLVVDLRQDPHTAVCIGVDALHVFGERRHFGVGRVVRLFDVGCVNFEHGRAVPLVRSAYCNSEITHIFSSFRS